MGEQQVGGWKYPNGDLISEHPSEDEIQKHWQFWVSVCSAEQAETIVQIRDAKVFADFKKLCPRWSKEEAVQQAIRWWEVQWPWEVKAFLDHITTLEQTQANKLGFSNEKDKLMMRVGVIPPTIKTLLSCYSMDLIAPNDKGRLPEGYRLFFQYCPKARTGGRHG